MAIRIIEIHPPDSSEALNSEWFTVENTGDKPFSTKNCSLATGRKGSRRKTQLGTMDPGFVLPPGGKVRIVTGTPGRKAHGPVPNDDGTHYNLFLDKSVLAGPGNVLELSLRSRVLARATFDAKSPNGILAEESD